MRHLIVEQSTGKIVNVIMYAGDSDYHPGDGMILVRHDDHCDIGWIWDGQKLIDPNPPPPPPPPPPPAGEVL